VDPNPPSVHFDNALRYGKPQASAALLAGDGIVGLLELLKQLGLVGGRDTGSGVTDRYIKCAIIRFDLDGDFAGISELNSIADEIDQARRQAAAVATARWQVGGHLDLKRELLVGRERLQCAADRLGNVLDGVIGQFEHKLARLDLGQVEHVIDESEQMLAVG